MQTRRDILNSTLALTAAAATAGRTARAVAAVGGGVDPSALSARLTLADGTVMTFAGSQGSDLGDFVVSFAGIVQRNVLVTEKSSLFSVFFRPDRNSPRVEVIVLYGNPLNAAPATHPGYSFEIFENGKSLQKVDVPFHYWLARWRWCSAPRARVRTPTQLIAAKLTPPYGVTSMATDRMPKSATPYSIMGISNITPFMGQTGERIEIGQNPEYHSAYMATEDSGCYQSMLEWAEASATGPWHINDPNTHKIINWDDWPGATTFETRNSNPPFYVMLDSEKDENKKRVYPGFLRPDDAHHPCTSYIPFISTGDPFHAEELQYQINLYLGAEHGTSGRKTHIFDTFQTRGFAWMMRSTLDNALAADLIQSPVLLPKSFWQKVLDNNRAYVTANFVNATDGKAFYFSSGISRFAMAWWQEDYLCGVMGMAVQLGFKEWLAPLQWKIKSNVNRINGTSGWNPAQPTIYYAQYVKQSQRPGPKNVGTGVMEFAPFDERGNLYDYLGEWQLRFKSPTEFDIVTPNGTAPSGPVTSGVVGKRINSGYVPLMKIVEGNVPFAAGDVIFWSLTKITNWKELWEVNLALRTVKDADPDDLPLAASDYMYSLYAALVLAAPSIPEVASLLPKFISKMESGRARLSWRDSFVLPKS